ncbi:ADP-heptose synthase [Ferviditalea candida]|uniref:ADP-heptose synthase n=1 Tax=Ferviditalea candida TaxID=3108399 RepID=A0ABU5ZL13_9BACL|nr:ADP-heptose synthase [Paenibacillaceae bacterium T2]
MQRRFVIEAVMAAVYGQLLVPGQPVEYIIPYSTVMELYEFQSGRVSVMPEEEDDAIVKSKIDELIRFLEEPLNKKKIERALSLPWRKSPAILVNDQVSFTIVNALDNAQYGDSFDPIETELMLTSIREQAPILTDQIEFVDRLVQSGAPVQVVDIDDFEYALEADIPFGI